MLSDVEREAVARWYARPEVLEQARALHQAEKYEELEEYLHKTCLMPLGRHDELPDYLRKEDGGPLFPENLNPGNDLEQWQDAIEVGWEVMRDQLGIEHDDLHRAIAAEQQDEWQAFLDSVERRKRERDAD